jgi:hypothetical protein
MHLAHRCGNIEMPLLCCTTMEINMRWILVFYIIGSGAGGGPATAEFLTSVDCEAAGRAIHDKWQAIHGADRWDVRWICVNASPYRPSPKN